MMDDDDDDVWSNQWYNWQGKPNYSEKPTPVPLCRPQIPHDLTPVRSRAAAVGSWVTALSTSGFKGLNKIPQEVQVFNIYGVSQRRSFSRNTRIVFHSSTHNKVTGSTVLHR
jgi:hypothetical protein